MPIVNYPDNETSLMELVLDMHEKITRMEQVLAQYQPMLEEAARRMAGPMRWNKRKGQ